MSIKGNYGKTFATAKGRRVQFNSTVDEYVKDRFHNDCFAAGLKMSAVIENFMISFSSQARKIREENKKALQEQEQQFKK